MRWIFEGEGDVFGYLNNSHDKFVEFIANIEMLFQQNFESTIVTSNVYDNFRNICNTASLQRSLS